MVAPERPPPPVTGRIGSADLPVVALGARVGPTEIAAVCGRVRQLICDQGANTVVVDVSRVVGPDVEALDALARLHLMARRFGRKIMIRHSCEQLEELVAFAGLDGVLCLEDEREPE